MNKNSFVANKYETTIRMYPNKTFSNKRVLYSNWNKIHLICYQTLAAMT